MLRLDFFCHAFNLSIVGSECACYRAGRIIPSMFRLLYPIILTYVINRTKDEYQ